MENDFLFLEAREKRDASREGGGGGYSLIRA